MAFIEPMHCNKPNITYLQAITWAALLTQVYVGSYHQATMSWDEIVFFQENEFENVVCKMSAILFGDQSIEVIHVHVAYMWYFIFFFIYYKLTK